MTSQLCLPPIDVPSTGFRCLYANSLKKKMLRPNQIRDSCFPPCKVMLSTNSSTFGSVTQIWKKPFFEGLDIALNNAGINLNPAAEETPVEDWDMTFAVNLRGVFLCCQAKAREMLPRGYGKIINMASTSSLIVPHPQKQAAYKGLFL